MIKWIGITILVLIAVPVAGFYIAVFHTATERELTCEGAWERGGNGQAETAHIAIQEPRFWVWWFDGDGHVQVQTENLAISAFVPYITKIGEGSVAIYMFNDGVDGDGEMVGGYQEASRELTLEITDDLLFVGRCRDRV